MKNLSSVIAVFSMLFMVSCGSSASSEKADSKTATANVSEATFTVYGNCGMCKKRIEKAAKSVEGVESATWDKETKQLTITHAAGINIHTVHQAIADAGHDTDMHKAKDEVYNELPGCCHYRDSNPHEEHEH